jgi:hypothetical protein
MPESIETYSPDLSNESMSSGSEQTESRESIEAGMARVEKNQKKAKAVAQQIKKSKTEN